MSNSLWPHGLQQTRLPCPSPSPRACSNSCPLSRWCHPTISSSVVPFSRRLSFPTSRSFQMSQLFASGGQSIKSFSFSINPSNKYSGLISFRIDCFDLLPVQRTFKSLLLHHSLKASTLSILYGPTLISIYDCWKNHSFWLDGPLSAIWSLLFNMLSRFVIAFLPRSKHLLVSWLQSPSAVILEPKKVKSVTVFTFPHQFAMKW